MIGAVHGTNVELQIEPGFSIETGDREAALLRIAHEALHNAVRHARAEHVTVRVGDAGGGLVVEVTDDGIGFDPDRPDLRSMHLGLTSMEERARELRGRLRIHSKPGTGTTVRIELAADA